MAAEIDRLAGDGHRATAIAQLLNLSPRTVQRHLPSSAPSPRPLVRGAPSERPLSARVFAEVIRTLLTAYNLDAADVERGMAGPDAPSNQTLSRLLSGSRDPTFAAVARLLYGIRSAQMRRRALSGVDATVASLDAVSAPVQDFLVSSRTPASLLASAQSAAQLLQYLCRPTAGGSEDARYTRAALDRPMTWPVRVVLDHALRAREIVISDEERNRLLTNLIATVELASASEESQGASEFFMTNCLNLLPRAAQHIGADRQAEVATTLQRWFHSPGLRLDDPRAERSWYVGWVNWWMTTLTTGEADVPPEDLATSIPQAFLGYLEAMDAGSPFAENDVPARASVLKAMTMNLDYLDLVCGGDEPRPEVKYRAATRFLTRSASRDRLVAALDIRSIYWAVAVLSPGLLRLPLAREEVHKVTSLDRVWEVPRQVVLSRDAQAQVVAAIDSIRTSTATYVDQMRPLLADTARSP